MFAFSRLQRSIVGHYLGIERSLEVRGLYLAEISLVEVRIALKHSNWRVQAVRGITCSESYHLIGFGMDLDSPGISIMKTFRGT